MMAELLTVDGFDMEKVSTMLEESDLDAVQKGLLTEGLEAAQNNPEMLGTALEKIREALGM